ncbi:signal transduction histidine kinase, LytS [Pseudoxanthomonas suwonensis 11-1]|uniref:Signal transduction histidine kinase, LytS n=1 Tax=Pseudoxanthomonas suwonensis (strain 11-1) TaxID=743721 RepID=E6WW11_PSEUU|nr:histidine kinase [Pseudoxanthomonas suwonensis]ADV28502.1 signal transduction histidine kinase, LytS [Pseudoxanthomonas suwonensis 11-1]
MSSSLILIVRILFAWAVAVLLAGSLWGWLFDGIGGVFALLAVGAMALALLGAITHVRRVSLLAGRLDAAVLANRQQRRIELPMETVEAYELVAEVLHHLPRSGDVETSPGSLQVQARVRRSDPFGGARPSRWNLLARFAVTHDRVLATVHPGNGTVGVTVLCEPDAAHWVDLFALDEGSNYQNAESVLRALSSKAAAQRREEQARAEREATDNALTVARLNLLQAQVEPHFLYNTLANAQVLARTDPPRAEQMLGHLIQYLRHSLPREHDTLSTLGEELERTRAYLEILKIRMGTRLQLQVEIPDALKQVTLPSMMLQTLVENAIKHGLEPKPGGGTIWILARQVDDQVTVTVADDGCGFGDGASAGTGIGLKNVRERLRLTYGDAASFSIVSNFPSGVAATIAVPAPAPATAPVQPPPVPAAAVDGGIHHG